MNLEPSSNSPTLLGRLSESDRERLGDALRRLAAHGSILGLEPGQAELFHWCDLNREWVEEMAGLLDLKLYWDRDLRLVQAVPQTAAFTLRMKLDATLVLLTLWYEFDTAVRDRGEAPPIRLTVKQLNESLETKFEPLKPHLPRRTRMKEILLLAQRKNLLRFAPAEDAAESMIEVLPTLKRVIAFQNLDEWTRAVERYLATAADPTTERAAAEEAEASEGGETE
jgi:hypothetical protein